MNAHILAKAIAKYPASGYVTNTEQKVERAILIAQEYKRLTA
jgi:hypothetical protein